MSGSEKNVPKVIDLQDKEIENKIQENAVPKSVVFTPPKKTLNVDLRKKLDNQASLKAQRNPCTQNNNVPYYTPERVLGPNLVTRTSAPQYSFGLDNFRYDLMRKRSNGKVMTSKNVKSSNSSSPGPKYNIGTSVDAIKPKAPAFSMGIRTRC